MNSSFFVCSTHFWLLTLYIWTLCIQLTVIEVSDSMTQVVYNTSTKHEKDMQIFHMYGRVDKAQQHFYRSVQTPQALPCASLMWRTEHTQITNRLCSTSSDDISAASICHTMTPWLHDLYWLWTHGWCPAGYFPCIYNMQTWKGAYDWVIQILLGVFN